MPEDIFDPIINDIMLKPVPPSFEDQNVIVLFQAMREDIKEMRKLHRDDVIMHGEVLNKIVGWDKCSTLRNQCHVENGNKFNDIFRQLGEVKEVCADYMASKGETVTPLSLSRAEGTVLDKARAEDDKILLELEKIKTSVRGIENKLVIFNFSRCSLEWIWANKKGIAIVIGLVSLWLFGIDMAARASCVTRFI